MAKRQTTPVNAASPTEHVYEDMPQIKKPPPVAPRISKVVRAGGQPLPGMVRSCSVTESNQQSGRGRLTMQSHTTPENAASPSENVYENIDDLLPQKKKPPPVAPRIGKVVRAGGQPLPGMVRSCSVPESNQQNGRGRLTMQRNTVEDGIGALTLQSSQTSVEPRTVTTRRVLFTQKTWHGEFQQNLYSQSFYHESSSIQTVNFSQCSQDSQGSADIMEWWNSEEPWKESSCTNSDDAHTFTQKAEDLKRALYIYDYLLSERGAKLQGHIIELQEVAGNIDKVHKGVKIAGITGGAAGAVGVAAAVGGVILAPVTLGASLAVTAIGVGVAAAGGVTGASAAITKKVHKNMDRKKVETILKEHSTQIEEIERCLKFIGTNIDSLKKYDPSTLRGVDWKAVKMAKMGHNVGDSVGVIGAVSKSSGMIEGFTLGLDMYFNKEDSEQLKKGAETKFAKQIHKVAKQMQATLDELMKFKTMVGSEDI